MSRHCRSDRESSCSKDDASCSFDRRACSACSLARRACSSAAGSASVNQQMQLAEDPLAVLLHRQAVDLPERRVLDHLAGFAPGVSPRAKQHPRDQFGVDVRFGGGCFGRTDSSVDHEITSR